MDSIDSLMDIELDRSQHSSVTDETLSTAAAPVSNQVATPVAMERSDWSFSTSTSSTADINDDEDDDEDYVNDADDDEENADDDERNDVNEEDRNDYDDDDDSESIDIEDDINEPDRDDNESTDLIIAVDFKSPVVIMPRSSADGAWSTSSPISPESMPLLSHAGVADLTESSQSAPVVSVGATSALTSTVPSSASSAGSPRRYSNVIGSSTADSYSIVPVPASSTVPASNAAGISAASQASAADSGRRKSGFHHRQTKQLQSQQQQDHQRQTPIISGCLPTSTTESRGSTTAHQHQPHQRQESSTANPSHHQPSAQQQQQSIDAGSAWSTARAAAQFADSLRRRTDSLTQKCLRLQKESLNKAIELRTLSEQQTKLQADVKAEHETQLRLVKEYYRVKGMAQRALSVMRKVNVAQTLLTATRDHLLDQFETDATGKRHSDFDMLSSLPARNSAVNRPSIGDNFLPVEAVTEDCAVEMDRTVTPSDVNGLEPRQP